MPELTDTKGTKAAAGLTYLIHGLMLIQTIYILVVCIFYAHLSYARKLKGMTSNKLLILIGIAGLYSVFLFLKKAEKYQVRNHLLLGMIAALFFVWQVYASYSYYFLSGWDTLVIRTASLAYAEGNAESLQVLTPYFSQYPNNCLIVVIFGLISRAGQVLGIGSNHYFLQIIFQCALNSLSGILIFLLGEKLFQKACAAWMSYFLYLGLVGISPWVSIPYSDSLALIFPVLLLYIMLCMRNTGKTGCLRTGLIFFLSMIGYAIKPQVLIVLIAYIISRILDWIRGTAGIRIDRESLKKGICAVCGVIAAFLIIMSSKNVLRMNLDQEQAFGWSHYVMMGLNKKKNGTWSRKDVMFSMSFPTKKERTRENLRVAKERIEKFGVEGLRKHIRKKTLTNYNDGTFTWGREGEFFLEVSEDRTPLSSFLKSIYYNKKVGGRRVKKWRNFAQSIWIALLFFLLCGVISKPRQEWTLIILSILGIMLFELIFEARSRYFYHYVPVFILLGTRGIVKIDGILVRIRNTGPGCALLQ